MEVEQGPEEVKLLSGKRQKVFTLSEIKSIGAFYDIRPFIFEGYRANMTYSELANSLFTIHNETMNVWTHFLPFVYFSYYIVLLSLGKIPQMAGHETLMTVACLGELACFGASSVYHLFKDKDERHCHALLKVDLVGILLMIFVLSLTCVWVGFSLHPEVRQKVVTLLLLWACASGGLAMTPCYAAERCERVRIAHNVVTILLCYGLALFWYFYLSSAEEVALLFGPLMLSYVWLGIGFAFYASKFPECYFTPERFGRETSKMV